MSKNISSLSKLNKFFCCPINTPIYLDYRALLSFFIFLILILLSSFIKFSITKKYYHKKTHLQKLFINFLYFDFCIDIIDLLIVGSEINIGIFALSIKLIDEIIALFLLF